jgi:hypothetical protein
MTSHEHESVEGEHVRYAEYVLRYDRVQLQRAGGSERRPVFVRIAEEISYPSDWMASGALYGRVRRRVVLRSAYHKPK